MAINSGSQLKLCAPLIQHLLTQLDHVHVQLDELQQDQPPDRHRALALTMRAYIAEIGELAAKGGLSTVKEVCDRAILLVETVQHEAAERRTDDYVAICRGLGQIRQSLLRSVHVTADGAPSMLREGNSRVTIAVGDLLARLYRVREGRLGSGRSSGGLLQTMIDEVEKLRKSRVEQCGVTFLHGLLDEGLKRETNCAALVQAEVPRVIEMLELLANEQEDRTQQLLDQLQIHTEQTARLVSTAKQANAPLITYLEGLLGFLTVLVQQRILVAAQRYEAVASRMRAYLASLSLWLQEEIADYSVIRNLLGSEGCGKETANHRALSPHANAASKVSTS